MRASSPFLRAHCALRARARCAVVFILCRTAKNEPRKRAKGLCPLDSRGAARELSIFPPRGKNVYQHFSSAAKMIEGYRFLASGNPKISLLLWVPCCPSSVFQDGFSRTPPFLIWQRRVHPKLGIDPQPNPILGVRLCAQDGTVLLSKSPQARRSVAEQKRADGSGDSKGHSPWFAFLVRSFSNEKE